MKAVWALVGFNEEKRVFDTGNVKKMISDDGMVYMGRQRPLPTHVKGTPMKWVTLEEAAASAANPLRRGGKSGDVKTVKGTGRGK